MLKMYLKKILIIVLELVIISGLLWYIAQKKGIKNFEQFVPALEKTIQETKQRAVPFPELSQPVVKKFEWEYKGKKYSLEQTLYKSVYEYYKVQPKEYSYSQELPANWKEEYYKIFLENDSDDKTIEELSQQIKMLGVKKNLTDDQIVELIVSFVQAIPYDDAKAANILNKTGSESMRFSYEVLWEQIGVCSDKSLLAYLLLDKLGYGVALFEFKQENHMALGVECPQDYSNYDSGYCYVETTSVGNKVGVIPDFDTQSGKATDIKQIDFYDSNQNQPANFQKLSQVEIVLPKKGKQYLGIIQTEKIAKQIEQLKKEMETLSIQLISQRKKINSELKMLEDLKDDLKKYERDENIDKYNATVEKYNNLLSEYKKDLKKYNNSVTLYNADVKKYNTLIKQ